MYITVSIIVAAYIVTVIVLNKAQARCDRRR
jgi:hypothetical protein